MLEKAIAIVTEAGRSLGLAECCSEIELFAADAGPLLLSLFAERRDTKPGTKFAAMCDALTRFRVALQVTPAGPEPTIVAGVLT